MGADNFRIARTAQEDLDQIFDYIARESDSAAVRVMESLHQTFETLGSQSQMGEMREEIAPGLRQFIAKSPAAKYVIYYRLATGAVEIARVLHGSRDLPKLIE